VSSKAGPASQPAFPRPGPGEPFAFSISESICPVRRRFQPIRHESDGATLFRHTGVVYAGHLRASLSTISINSREMAADRSVVLILRQTSAG
jgi:hypothetical protein